MTILPSVRAKVCKRSMNLPSLHVSTLFFPRCLCTPHARHGFICFDAVNEIQLSELWSSDSTFCLHVHLFHWNISRAENRSNYSHLLASLLWKCLYFRIPGVSIFKMSLFVFDTLHLCLYILAINVNSNKSNLNQIIFIIQSPKSQPLFASEGFTMCTAVTPPPSL